MSVSLSSFYIEILTKIKYDALTKTWKFHCECIALLGLSYNRKDGDDEQKTNTERLKK